MRGWGLGERLDLLFDSGDSGNDLDSDEEGTWGIVKWMEHLVNHRSHCESPWLAEKEATFLWGLARKGGWPRVSAVIQGGTPPRRGVLEVQSRPFRTVFLPRFIDGEDQDKCE